ncbi:hydrogen peroxide-inducible genes activator [Epibacterium ulvae]|uniref:hydrogen peroxide-inducible genes activator n=1 Tax=Epibacterium ulvae TaxID=1156985 RepID=UPI0024936C5E|nr:hydrogen peroxide-inducible genes activator [Epibacterium ulvae]
MSFHSSKITLRQLRYFEALADQKHFGHAADLCAVSQPALSVQIKELEETLGLLLFERGARHVRLTSFGEEFQKRSKEILRAVDELGDLARAAGAGLSGRFRLGIIPTVAPYLLPQIVSGVSEAYPNIELRIRETLTQNLIAELRDGRLDCAIVALPLSESGFSEHVLFKEEFVLVRPQGQGDWPVPSRDRLREMQLLLLEEGHCFRDQALSFCDMRPAEPRELLDGSALSTLVQMVASGIGLTLIPEMAVEVETRSAPVAISRFPSDRPTRTLGMIWRKTTPLAPQLAEFSETIAGLVSPK